jgi:HK97 family phage major capsid protein
VSKKFEALLNDALHKALDPVLDTEARKSAGEPNDTNGEDPSISKYLRGMRDGNWAHAEKEEKLFEEVKKYSSDVGEEGGQLIHPKIADQIIPLIRNNTVIRGLGPQVVQLPNTNTLELPRQTSGSGYAWVGESDDIETAVGNDEVTWGDLELSLKTVVGFARIPNTLIEDSTPAADQIVRNDIAKVLGIAEDLAIMVGEGGTQPLGLYYWDDVADNDVDAALTFNDIIDAQTAIESNGGEYRYFVCHPQLKGQLRQIVDSDGRYVWQQGDVTKDAPDTLLGIPCVYSTNIPTNIDYDGSTAANRTFAILADFSELLIIEKERGIKMDSSTEASDSFLNYETLFRAIRRMDSGPRVPENFYFLKNIDIS